LYKERKVGNREKGYILLYGYWVNGCYIVYRTRDSAGACLLLYSAIFCQVLPTIVIYGQCAAMCGNMPFAAIRNVLLYSARLLLYSARVGLYGVGGVWWE